MLNRFPKPVIIAGSIVIVLLALVIIFKSTKSAGGAGDYDANEIKRLSRERENKPNGGRTMPNASRKGSPDRLPGSGGYPPSGGR